MAIYKLTIWIEGYNGELKRMFIQFSDKYGQMGLKQKGEEKRIVRSRYIVIISLKELVCYKRPKGSSSLELELDKVSASGTFGVFTGLGFGSEVSVLFVACFFAFGL